MYAFAWNVGINKYADGWLVAEFCDKCDNFWQILSLNDQVREFSREAKNLTKLRDSKNEWAFIYYFGYVVRKSSASLVFRVVFYFWAVEQLQEFNEM